MSAFGGKADIWLESAPVRYGPAVSSGVPMRPSKSPKRGQRRFQKAAKAACRGIAVAGARLPVQINKHCQPPFRGCSLHTPLGCRNRVLSAYL